MSFVPRFHCFLLLGLFAALTAAAQDDAPKQALEAANAIYGNGDYPAAVAAYEKILADYPTSPVVGNAQIQLAYACFLDGQNQKSLDTLAKLRSGPPPPKLPSCWRRRCARRAKHRPWSGVSRSC